MRETDEKEDVDWGGCVGGTFRDGHKVGIKPSFLLSPSHPFISILLYPKRCVGGWVKEYGSEGGVTSLPFDTDLHVQTPTCSGYTSATTLLSRHTRNHDLVYVHSSLTTENDRDGVSSFFPSTVESLPNRRPDGLGVLDTSILVPVPRPVLVGTLSGTWCSQFLVVPKEMKVHTIPSTVVRLQEVRSEDVRVSRSLTEFRFDTISVYIIFEVTSRRGRTRGGG